MTRKSLTVACPNGGFLPQCFNMFQTDFSSVAVARDAFTSSSLAGDLGDGVPLGHGNDFFDECHVIGCSKKASQVDW